MRTLVLLAFTTALAHAVTPADILDTAKHTVDAVTADVLEEKQILTDRIDALKQPKNATTAKLVLPPLTKPAIPPLNETALSRKVALFKALLANKTAVYGGDTLSDAYHFWKELATEEALEAKDDVIDVATLPLAWADWLAAAKANVTAILPETVFDAKADASATSATALALAHGGFVPAAEAALYPGFAYWINNGAAMAEAGGYDWATASTVASGRRRLQVGGVPDNPVTICEPTGLTSFPPPLRGTVAGPAVCSSAAAPMIATRGPEWFAAVSPTNATAATSSTQTLYMLYLANLAYSALLPDGSTSPIFTKSAPCLLAQGFTPKVGANVPDIRIFSGLVPKPFRDGYTNATVVALVLYTTTDIFVSFQGSNSVSDFLSVNVRAWPKYTNIYTPPRWVPVHEGFHAAWQTLSAQVLGAVDELAATKMATPDWKVWFTGHSLGAAMTTLAAAQFANSRSADRVGGVYPFSSPRVGSGAFSAGYNAVLGSKTLLVTYGGDAVSMLPYRVTWNYKHVGRQVGLCRSSTNALEVAQVNPINRDSGDGCDNYAAETYFALAAFTRHSPGLIWDALLRTIAGSGGAFSDGAARAACLGAGLATCPGVTGAKKACAAILRCDAWLGTPDQICQSCANGGTCGPSGTLYAGPWQNNALPGCSQSLGIVQGLAPTTCAA